MERCIEPKLGKNIAAYELQLLTEEESMQFELHMMNCDYCLRQVKDFDETALTLRKSTRARKLVARSVSPNLGRLSGIKASWRYLWPDTPLLLKPAILLFSILLMIYPTFVGIGLKGRNNIRLVQSISLMPTRSVTKIFYLTSDKDIVITFISPEASLGSFHKVSLRSADSSIIFSDQIYTEIDDNQVGRIIVPVSLLESGQYILEIGPLSDATRHTYRFDIQLR